MFRKQNIKMIRELLALALCLLFTISALAWSANAEELNEDEITVNLGTRTTPDYFVLGTVGEIPGMTLQPDTLKTDIHIHDFYFTADDPEPVVTIAYITGSPSNPKTLSEEARNIFISNYGESCLSEMMQREDDTPYFFVTYEPTEEEIQKAQQNGLEPMGYHGVTFYLQAEKNCSVVVTLVARMEGTRSIYSYKELLAQADDVLKAITIP